MRTLFGILFIASTLVQLYARWCGREKLRDATKGIILASLIGFYLASSPAPRPVFVLALVFGWLGDILLIWPKMLKYGGVAFFLGHMMYIASFWAAIAFGEIPIWQHLAGAAFYVLVAVLMLRFVGAGMDAATRRSSIGYVSGICCMSFCALLQCLSLGGSGGALVLLGSLIFILSDLNLLIRNFRPETPIPKKQFVVMLTYAAAQALLVSGTLLIERARI